MTRMIRIQYPDKTIHDVEVFNFYRTENNMYCIEYYDTHEQANMYTVLLNINNVLVKDPNNKTPYDDLTQNSTKLDLNILPGYIPCITLINQNKTQTQTQRQFIVYVDQNNNKYIAENVASKHDIPNRGGNIVVDGITFIKVYQSDIDDIIKKSKNTEIPKYINYYNKQNKYDEYHPNKTQTQTQKQFIVYVDQNNNKYIADNIANKYDIPNRGGNIVVDGITFIKVHQSDIDDIIKKSRNTEVPAYRDYHNKENDTNNNKNQQTQENPTKNVRIHHIISYYCDQNNKYYLDREGLVISRNYNVEIEGKPIIILDRNCYSILESQLDELKRKSSDTHTWIKNGVITKDNKTKEKAILSTYICRINNEIFIPLDTYTKYKERINQKLIKVDGNIYINITEDDLAELKRLYNKDNIDLALTKKEVMRKNKELDSMLKNKSTSKEDTFQK